MPSLTVPDCPAIEQWPALAGVTPRGLKSAALPSVSSATKRRRGVILLGLAAVALVGRAAVAQPQFRAASDHAEAGLPAGLLLSPTLGRPAFVEPGAELTIVAHVPDAPAAPAIALVWSGPLPGSLAAQTDRGAVGPPQRYGLAAPEESLACLREGRPIRVTVPREIPARTYDLELDLGPRRLAARHCVAVGRVPERLRLVHLSNMNLGEPGAPDCDERLIDEVNLVAPTLIVLTGDLLDATHPAPQRGWERLVDFLCRFDAPALIACGDHDDLAHYARHVAPSPIGAIAVGGYQGVVLFDTAANPIANDADQVRWVERTLAVPGDVRPTFVVAHDECPNLLRLWREAGRLADMVRATRLAIWFAGGHTDWDAVEYRELIDAARPMLYVRTRQASTAARDGGDGVSHYRVLDLRRDHVWLPGGDARGTALPPALPVGRLSVASDGPNDGTHARVSFTAVNNLPFRLDDLCVRVWLARAGDARPWCLGAELESVVEFERLWECRVRFGLPDKGALRAVVGVDARPAQPEIEVVLEAPPQLPVVRRLTADGVAFLSAEHVLALVHLHNRAAEPVVVTPLVRLDGNQLAYVVLDEPAPPATACRLRLPPARRLTLQVDFSAIRVAPGRRELQVYLQEPAAWRPVTSPLEVVLPP